jgi:hypothetical protein
VRQNVQEKIELVAKQFKKEMQHHGKSLKASYESETIERLNRIENDTS